MRLQIITPSKRVTKREFRRSFERKDIPGAGWGFPCNEDGSVVGPLHSTGAENYWMCITGQYDIIDRGVEVIQWSYRLDAIGKCECGRTIALRGDTDCECGRIYNHVGQQLNPRHMWGDDTGEHFESFYEED